MQMFGDGQRRQVYGRRHSFQYAYVYVAVCCSVLQCGAVWCSVVQCGAVYCSVSR